jgi:hypothetical protein
LATTNFHDNMYDKYVHIYVRIYRTSRTEKGNADEIRIITGSQSRRPMERLDVECADPILTMICYGCTLRGLHQMQ